MKLALNGSFESRSQIERNIKLASAYLAAFRAEMIKCLKSREGSLNWKIFFKRRKTVLLTGFHIWINGYMDIDIWIHEYLLFIFQTHAAIRYLWKC